MLTRRRVRAAGFTIVELLIAVAVIGIVMLVGMPSLSTWIQNTQVRTSAESTMSGLQLARTEALRRNRTVQFSLVDSVSAGCAVSATGKSWVVSVLDPSGNCHLAPTDDPGDPAMIVQKRSGTEGSPNAVVTAQGGSALVFNGLARIVGAGITRIDFTAAGGVAECQGLGGVGGGPVRCLRVLITTSGQTRMCDPAVNDAADPRSCG